MHYSDVVVAGHICLDITPKFPESPGSESPAAGSPTPIAKDPNPADSGAGEAKDPHPAGSPTPDTRDQHDAGREPPASVLIPGTLVTVDGVDIHPGGVVANTGLAMQFFGNDVSLMGKIGTDVFGTMLLDLLNQWGT